MARTVHVFALLSILSILLLFSTARGEWREGDVSQLFPLPRPEESELALGVNGLLPETILARLSKLVVAKGAAQNYASTLKAVGMRLDPCFSEGPTPVACRHQIRLVWQPLTAAGAEDAAIHSFYDLDEREWSEFLANYRALGGAGDGAFRSRRLAAEGYAGEYWSQLRKLLQSVCNARHLTRVTQMTLEFNGHMWTFRGFNIESSGALRPIVIPRVGQGFQIVSMLDLGSLDLHLTVNPNAFDEVGLWVFDNSLEALRKFTTSELGGFVRELVRIEDPVAANSGTIDCAGCHLAQPAGDWAGRNFAGSEEEKYFVKSSRPTNFLRAFGYNGTEPAISRRARHETEAVLRALNAHP